MSREVQGIPPAPRPVRWSRVLGYRWPLAAVALALGAYVGLWTWMMFLAAGGKARDGRRLDAEPTVQASASVTKVEELGEDQRVDYTFEHVMASGQRVELRDTSFAPRGTFAAGDRATVELLPAEPNVSRLAGHRSDRIPKWLQPGPWFLLLVVPGLLAGLAWLAGVLHLRQVLVHGDVGIARVLSVRRVRWCLPETWSVQFTFRDHRAQERRSRHWVRAHSTLGARVRPPGHHALVRVPVLHDRRWPQYCRLVVTEDFAPAPERGPAATLPH